jgi:hypothetical protein
MVAAGTGVVNFRPVSAEQPGHPPPGESLPQYAPPPPPAVVHRERRWTPLLAVFLVLVFVVFGGVGITGALGEAPTEPPVDVAPGVRVTPQAGWVIQEQVEGSVLLTNGGGLLGVTAGQPQDPQEILDGYLQGLSQQANQLQVSSEVETVQLPAGLTGVRRAFLVTLPDAQTPIEGEATAVSSDQVALLFEGVAPQGQYLSVREDVLEMIDSTEVG